MLYNKQENTLRDRNLYIDKKNRLIYYRPRTKQGFVVSPGSENALYTFSQRFIWGVLSAIFSYLIINIIWIALIIGFAAYALMEYKYRSLMNTYPMIQNIDLTQCVPTNDVVKPETLGRVLLKVALYITLAVLLVVNLFVSKTEPDLVTQIISYIAAAGALYFAVKNLITLKR